MKQLLESLILTIAALTLFAGGCSTEYNRPLPDHGEDIRLLEPGDTVAIFYDGYDPGLSPIHDRISDDGAISLLVIGRIKVTGLTPKQAAVKIRDAYVPKYFSELIVNVILVEQAKPTR